MVESKANPAGDFETAELQDCNIQTSSVMAEAAAAALEEPDIEFWRMDSRRLSFGEWARICRGPGMIIGWMSKLLHLNLFARQFVPRVPRMQRFEVPAVNLGPVESARLKPRLEELNQLGFHSPVFAQIENPFLGMTLTTVSLMHPSRYSIGRVLISIPSPGSNVKEDTRLCFITELSDGGYLVTSSSRQDFDAVPGVRQRRLLNARINSLWHAHQEELARITAEARPIAIRCVEDVWRLGDEYDQAHFDAGERRGLYLRPDSQV